MKDKNLPLDCTEKDLLEKLFCLDPKCRITATIALKHPFFDNQCNENLTSPQYAIAHGDDFDDRFFCLKNLENNRLHIEDSRQHIKPEQWAMLVDWLFEIVCVFEKGTRIVFAAMGFLDQYSSQVKVSKNRSEKHHFNSAPICAPISLSHIK